MNRGPTESILDEVIEGVAVAVVGELVVSGREFLEALKSYGVEIPTEFGVLRENHSPSGNEGVDQGLLAHLLLLQKGSL